MRFILVFLIFFLGTTLVLVPDVEAQRGSRDSAVSTTNGEPTDPEGALALLGAAEIDPEDHEVSSTAPEADEDVDSWFEALMNLLRTLGILPPEDSGS